MNFHKRVFRVSNPTLPSRKMFTNIRVAYPLQMTSQQGDDYFKYVIEIETNDPSFTLNHSRTWRRYSEFRQLQTLLSRNNLTIEMPPLPTQGIFRDRQHPEFLENRRTGLEKFLKEVVDTPLCKADRALHLFVQTSLSIEDIVSNVEGIRHDKIETTQCDFPWWSVTTISDIRTDQKEETGQDFAKELKQTKHVTFRDEMKAIAGSNSKAVNYEL